MEESNSDFQDFEGNVVFQDPKRGQTVLVGLNEQRKSGKFCDILIRIGDCVIYGHRSVLSICMPQIFEDLNRNNARVAENLVLELKGLDPRAVEKLIEFSYTASIEISVSEAPDVFLAAKSLGLTDVENEALRLIEEKAMPADWLSVRKFARSHNCMKLLSSTENFLRENFSQICHEKEFMSLPRLQVELTGRLGQEGVQGEQVCKNVVTWAKKQLRVRSSTDLQILC